MSVVPTEPDTVLAAMDLRNVFDLLRHRHGLRKPVDVLLAAGLPSSRAYRRLQQPEKFEYGELLQIAHRYGIPPAVMVAGARETMKWMLENPAPSGDGPGHPHPPAGGPVSGESSSACTHPAQVIPIDRAPVRRLRPITATVAA